MQLTITIEGRKSIVNLDGKEEEMKTTFLKQMKLNDLIEYIKRPHG